jgi:hypothetical protein
MQILLPAFFLYSGWQQGGTSPVSRLWEYQSMFPGPVLIEQALTPGKNTADKDGNSKHRSSREVFFTIVVARSESGMRELVLTGSVCMALPVLKHRKFLLISDFATDFATPGRMYIPAFSIWTYSDMGKKCIIS